MEVKRRELLEQPESLLYHNVLRNKERDGLKNKRIGQSAAELVQNKKVQRLSCKGVHSSEWKHCGPKGYDIVRSEWKHSAAKSGRELAISLNTMDEIIIELENDEQLQKNIANIEQLMIDAMSVAIPHIKIKVESALMTRWYKEAEAIYDEKGLLQIWTPELQEAQSE